MTLPSPNPALPSFRNPYFQDNSFVKGDQQRANNGFIWNNLESLDTDIQDLIDTYLKNAIDYSKPLGEIFWLPDIKDTEFTWDALNPRDYFPAINLSAIDGSELYDTTDLPEAFITYMRTVKARYLAGRSGEVNSWSVTVSSATVTFPNSVSSNAVLASLVEDAAIDGLTSSINRYLQLGTSIYAVAISSVNLVARTLTLTEVPAEQGSQTAEWYIYKNTDAGLQIQIRSVSGESMISPNDPDGYFIGGLRTRGYFQGHWHTVEGASANIATSGAFDRRASGSDSSAKPIAQTIITDGTNGTPLVRKITHGPAFSGTPFMWCGGN